MGKWYESLDDASLLAYLAWGEASGESWHGQAAVMAVVLNRRYRPQWPDSIYGVIVQLNQFDGLARLGNSQFWIPEHLLVMGRLCVAGLLVDPTNGADHFCTLDSQPYWRALFRQTAQIGNHIFFIGH